MLISFICSRFGLAPREEGRDSSVEQFGPSSRRIDIPIAGKWQWQNYPAKFKIYQILRFQNSWEDPKCMVIWEILFILKLYPPRMLIGVVESIEFHFCHGLVRNINCNDHRIFCSSLYMEFMVYIFY